MPFKINRFSMPQIRRHVAVAVAALLGATLLPGIASADKIKNPTAVFSGLDKITGRIISFEVAIDETVQFGSLQVTARVCYTRPPTEAPQTDTFVEVDEVTSDKDYKRIFSGWMYAASPGLHGIEHPIYDIWLTGCKGGTDIIVDTPAATADAGAPATEAPPPDNATKPPAPNTPPPKPKRVVRQSPRPEENPEARRQPVQSFFPATDYTAEPVVGHDPAGRK